ncbi:MAG: hypothetical protein JWQ40_4466 [Segetibacter sp.]|nr:hypothetical protein [Segetibacter sp.]
MFAQKSVFDNQGRSQQSFASAAVPQIVIQPKLVIGAVNDPLEQEADTMADVVMKMPEMPSVRRKCADCEREEEQIKRKPLTSLVTSFLQTKSETGSVATDAVTNKILATKGSGSSMDDSTKSFMESRFGTDFSSVRIHNNDDAARMSTELNAKAFTVGNDIYFNSGAYVSTSTEARKLLAHELTHVVQQGGINSTQKVQRFCTSPADCSAPIPGSAAGFGASEASNEDVARGRRKRLTPALALGSGHGGSARQLELFFESQSPGLLSNLHGIFIDWDLSSGTGALTTSCADWIIDGLPAGTIPTGMAGAVKPCVFVHANLNQEAFAFNTTADVTIGGVPREDWRVATLQVLTHEAQHVIFDTATHPAFPLCSRAAIEDELSELSAEMSEFPVMFRAIPAGAPAGDPARVNLANWFTNIITNDSEGIEGILKTIGCRCKCTEVDAYVTDTFNFTSSSWTAAEKTAFNTELNRPGWSIRWPIAP